MHEIYFFFFMCVYVCFAQNTMSCQAVQINTYCCECRQTPRGRELCIVMQRHFFCTSMAKTQHFVKESLKKNVPYVCHVKMRNNIIMSILMQIMDFLHL